MRLLKQRSNFKNTLIALLEGHSNSSEVRESISDQMYQTTTCKAWFGYVTDGTTLLYCRSNGRAWDWSHRLPFSEKTLLFLVQVYRSLKRKPMTPQLLSDAFGRKSDVAHKLISIMCTLLSNPKHRTNMLFQEWRRLFEQVSTYNLDQLPSLEKWASQNEIVTRDASQILFAMHSYYNLIVKIFTAELLSVSAHSTFSVCEEIVTTRTVDELRTVLNHIENEEFYRRYRISNF